MIEFAELCSRDVREYWSDEERNFTPWLVGQIEADDTSNLEDTLGLDLEVIGTERSVGRYRVDILAEVVGDGRKVVIENQLSGSDHDHLGKSIAYAAGTDADIIVWIAPAFHDEHRDAVQWLNENTREGVDFFAIRTEVWTIENSPPAIRLNPVTEPSEWKGLVTQSDKELSDRDSRRLEFWTQFRDYISENDTLLQERTPRPLHYYSNPIGKSGVHLSFSTNSRSEELYTTMIIEDDEELYQALESDRDAIEEVIGQSLDWHPPEETYTGNMRSRIEIARDGDLENEHQWEEYQEWFSDYGSRFHEAFADRLQQL